MFHRGQRGRERGHGGGFWADALLCSLSSAQSERDVRGQHFGIVWFLMLMLSRAQPVLVCESGLQFEVQPRSVLLFMVRISSIRRHLKVRARLIS